MIGALSTAATGLEAQQAKIEQISNDMANVNTDGYKRNRTEFHDLMYQTLKEPGGQLGSVAQSPVGIQKGLGVKVAGTPKIFEQGPARMTYGAYDMMIEGKGFFQVQKGDGGPIYYTRVGAFHVDPGGRLALTSGARLLPEFQIPPNAMNVAVSGSGEVKATLPGGQEQVLGQIPLYSFINDEGLMAHGAGLFAATSASGEPLQGNPGENGLGLLQLGALEGSNVNVANSMVDMITTQRAYEMNTKMLSTADSMMQSLVNVK